MSIRLVEDVLTLVVPSSSWFASWRLPGRVATDAFGALRAGAATAAGVVKLRLPCSVVGGMDGGGLKPVADIARGRMGGELTADNL